MLNKKKIFLYFDRAIVACLCLLIFCLPFSKAATETFTLFAFVLWILKRILGYRAEVLWGMLPKTALNIALLVYVLANAASIISCSNLGLYLRGFFGKELKFLFIYFMLIEVVNNKKRLLSILITIIASAVLITVDAFMQYYTGKDFLRGNHFDIFNASFSTSSGFAGWLVVIIPVLLGILITNIIPNMKLRILLSMNIIVLFLYLIRTYSRGAWLGFLIAILIIILYFIKKINFVNKILLLTTGVCLVAAFILLFLFLSPRVKYNILTKFKFTQDINFRLKSIPQLNKGSSLERIRLWRESLNIIRDYPLTGCGLNNYSIVARNYKSFEGGGIYPHNSFLQKAAETGIFGMIAFLFVLFSYFKTGFLHLNKKRNYLVLCLLAGIIASLVQSFFDTNLYSLQMVVLFWYMLGLTIAVINIDHENKVHNTILIR